MRQLSNVMAFIIALSSASALAADGPTGSQPTPSTAPSTTTRSAENTGINVRDKSGATQTPQKQTNADNDRKVLADVRRAVVGDKTLSTAAHNVKIITLNGVVTLRGPVRSSEEKVKIEKLAQQVAGVTSVENQLDVATN